MADRLEELLPGALRRHEGEAEGVAELAAGARARAARRARRRTAGVVVAAAIAVAAVPAVIALSGSSPTVESAPSPPTTSDVAPTPDPVPPGVRVESWRNLTVAVPADWGSGGGPDWCAVDGSRPRPGVSRPEDGARAIACTPRATYGLHFIDSSAIFWARDSGDVWQYRWESPDQVKMYPEDAWLGHFRIGDHALMVVARDEATARAVVESAREVTGTDPNGCAPRGGADAAAGEGDRWSVCRYTGDGWLVQSELLTADQSEQFLAAVRAAPLRVSVGSCPAPAPDEEPVGRVVVGNGSDLESVSVVFESFCPGANGVFMSGATRELTSDVLYWAISPGWSGGVDGSVPLPEPFRQR